MGVGGLDTALSGLRVAQQQLNVVANNVSNVNTEGYSRKILPQQTVVVGGDSAGVRANALIRNVDLNLERDFWTQVSSVEALDVKAAYLERIQQFHGSPDLQVSIAAELAELRDSFAALADSPEDNFLQRALVDQAGLLADKINGLAGLITEMRNDTQEELDTSIDTVNSLLGNIAQLNKQIKFNNASGKTVAELQDQRDQLIKELSSQMQISFFTRGDGVLVVQTRTGVQLADEKAETLYYNRTPIGPESYYPNPLNPSANGIFVGGNPKDNPVAIDITQTNLSGKIGALLELRDEIMPQNQAMLDELAHKLAIRFEQQGLTLFTDASGHVPSDNTANLTGTVDLSALNGGLGLSGLFGAPVFDITLNPNGTSPQARTMTIDIAAADAAYPVPPTANGGVALVNYINDRIAELPDAFSNTSASLDANGFLNITSDYDININASGAGQMGNAGLAVLGLTRGTTYAAPTTNPLVPVPYVGFSSTIRVNQAVLDDNRLVQQGTVSTDLPIQEGSNEVIRRILEFTFGDVQYTEAVGSVDLRASNAGETLQDWLGIYSRNTVSGTVNLASYADVNALIAAGGEAFVPPNPPPPILETFRLTFDEARTNISVPPLAAGDLDFDITLSNAQLQPGANAAQQIAAEINAQVAARVGLVPQVVDLDIVASVNTYGELVITSRGNITIDNGFIGGMTDEGMEFLGLTAGTYQTVDPYIDVQVGNDPPTRITIEPGDDETALYNKLVHTGGADTGVPGLAVDDTLLAGAGVTISSAGTLILRPGDSSSSPTFGGDIKIVGGPFTADGTGVNGTAAGTSIVEALFGTDDPMIYVPHEISTGTGKMEAFRRQGLGPNGIISTGIISSTNLIDYAQKLVNRQSAQANEIDARISDEKSFHDLLQRRLLDESGVNLDEELSNMIVIQTAYAAAARVVSAIDEQFQELLNAVR